MDEGSASGRFVGTVRATDAQAVSVTHELGGPGRTYFKINSATGVITTFLALDAFEASGWFVSVIATNDQGVTETVSVTINVIDINDHTPRFASNSLSFNVSELIPPSLLSTLRATDTDTGSNARVSYSIVSGNTNSAFSLAISTGALSIAKTLDYETLISYTLLVQAADGGSPSLTGFQTVTVNVLDENDFTPVLNATQYSATLFENATVGAYVVAVRATDGDGSSANNVVSYSFDDTTAPFSLNSSTGVMTVSSALDSDTDPPTTGYVFQLTARDNGNPSRAVTGTIRITLRDMNDNAPTFLDSGNYSVTFDEDITSFSTILEPNVIDYDIGSLNSKLAFSLIPVSPTVNRKFLIDSTSGVISTSAAFDLATDPARYVLRIRVTDRGTPPLTSETFVIIDVNDINTYTPSFNASSYLPTVAESASIGTWVVTVRATDLVCFA